jgi:Tfp pilus assembly protein PilO
MRGRGRLILAILGVLVALALVFFLVVNPRRNELSDLRVQVEQEEQLTQQLQTELARLQALEANAPELEAELARIRGFVPIQPEVPNFIFQVQEAANRAGLDFVQITPELPKQPPEGAALAEVRMTIGAKGGYFAMQDFIRRLYNLDRALRYDNFTLAFESDEFGLIRLDMTGNARIFFELPEPAGAATGTTTGTTGTAPAASPAPTTTP